MELEGQQGRRRCQNASSILKPRRRRAERDHQTIPLHASLKAGLLVPWHDARAPRCRRAKGCGCAYTCWKPANRCPCQPRPAPRCMAPLQLRIHCRRSLLRHAQPRFHVCASHQHALSHGRTMHEPGPPGMSSHLRHLLCVPPKWMAQASRTPASCLLVLGSDAALPRLSTSGRMPSGAPGASPAAAAAPSPSPCPAAGELEACPADAAIMTRASNVHVMFTRRRRLSLAAVQCCTASPLS